MHIGVCKYYIGPSATSLLTATAAAARIHSLHWVIKIKFQKLMLLCFAVKKSIQARSHNRAQNDNRPYHFCAKNEYIDSQFLAGVKVHITAATPYVPKTV